LSSLVGGEFHAAIVAGDPNGSPADSPGDRVDANTTTSPFAGIGSLQVNARRGTYICTATPIDATHVLTAGHCVDINDDGKNNSKDGITSIYFNLNYGGDLTDKIRASAVTVQPDYTGFNRPSVNDDLAIVTLASPLPAGVPVYGLPKVDLAAGTTLTMVGYGRSGDGVSGYTINASWTVKRFGENNADAFYTQDDAGRPAANEVFRFDFDGPSGVGSMGGATLGNDRETTIGGGDSGGPSLVQSGTSYVLVGVNTFTQGFNAPKFGSLGGGINVFPYVGWINSVLGGSSASSDGGGSGGPGAKGNGALDIMAAAFTLANPAEFATTVSLNWDAVLTTNAQHDGSLSVQFDSALPSSSLASKPQLVDSHAAQPKLADDDQASSLVKSRHDRSADDGALLDANSSNAESAVDEILTHWPA
jgi:hypothetical protein